MMEPAQTSWSEAPIVPSPALTVVEQEPVPADGGYDPDAIFDLIERTAETIRALRKNEDAVAVRELSVKAQLDRDRAIWRKDLDELRRTVETCLERAAAAEAETAEASTQAKSALELCDETRRREAAALDRAEVAEARAKLAEERYARLEAYLSKSFAEIAARPRRAAG